MTTAQLEMQVASDLAAFKRLVEAGYDVCADAYLEQHAAEDPDDMRLAPWQAICSALPDGGHVLDAGCGAGVPLAKMVADHPKGKSLDTQHSATQRESAHSAAFLPPASTNSLHWSC
eukprot:SAG31_NODE_13298_length_878_cov_1.648267_1_plen_117_part_00